MREFLGRVSGVTGPALTVQPLKNAAKLESSTKSEPSTKSESSTRLESSTKSESSTRLEPSTKSEPGTVTSLKLKDCSEIQMHPKEQPTQEEAAEATQAQTDPKSLPPEVNWGSKLFYGVLISVMVFFWWLLIYSGGVAGSHG